VDKVLTLDEPLNCSAPADGVLAGAAPNGKPSAATPGSARPWRGASGRVTSIPTLERPGQTVGSGRHADDTPYRLLLTIPEVCGALAVSRDAVYELLRGGRLPSVTLGRSRRIRIADLERFVAGLPRTAA
jgi:excisionase family DNA binding protein